MNLHELFTTQLPLNRKERYYTGTVLPQIIAADNFSGFNKFWNLISGEPDLEILVTPSHVNIQFFTEYNLKESAYNNIHADAFGKVEGDTPDVLILIITPEKKILIAVEAKMYEPVHVSSLIVQMMKQKKVLDILCSQLEVETENLFHVALVPEVYKRAAVSEIESVFSWEEVITAYEDRPNYFLDVLKYAIESYDKLVSTRGSSKKSERKMTGWEIYNKHKDGTLDYNLIGRGKGLKQLLIDTQDDKWERQSYEVSSNKEIPNRNWCFIQDFINLVNKKDRNPPT